MDLAFPPIYLLPNNLSQDLLHELEDEIPTLTYDIKEAKVVLGKITQKKRAELELRSRKLFTEEIVPKKSSEEIDTAAEEPPKKRRRVSLKAEEEEIIIVDSSTESEDEYAIQSKADSVKSQQGGNLQEDSAHGINDVSQSSASTLKSLELGTDADDTIKVVKLSWYTDCVKAGALLPLDPYIIYQGKVVDEPVEERGFPSSILPSSPRIDDILSRARGDAPGVTTTPFTSHDKHQRSGQLSQSSQTRPTHLLQQTTSEHDNPRKLPEVPPWLRNTYSCTRPTPFRSDNDPFLCQLKKIKLHRKLTFDQIGVRAYSTSIATLAAYPYLIQSAAEIIRLPGCENKIGLLFQEWQETGVIKAVQTIEADEKFQVLSLFYEIWGCAEATANEFWNKGYRNLDDVVEYEWDKLSRVQQIGLKYYDEFQDKIPRSEVESIAERILAHANKLHSGFQMCIVGGYRRGKPESGDVDVVLTHPDEALTANFIDDIVDSLEQSGWVSHMLITTRANSERGQTPVSWRGDMKKAGTGFDTLDKALLVWQDPNWPTKAADLVANPKAKNPNIHRRVDIIISPWKTAGCAIMGWTSGTTFQRDLRRYCKTFKDLKFDSSGIRSNVDGTWIDLESEGGDTLDLIEKEKRVFKGLGLEWREPTMRCTG